jgi:hypothetical protein
VAIEPVAEALLVEDETAPPNGPGIVRARACAAMSERLLIDVTGGAARGRGPAAGWQWRSGAVAG